MKTKPAKPPGPPQYSVGEAAEYLKTSARSVRDKISAGTITYRRKGGSKNGEIFFFEEDLKEQQIPRGGPGAIASKGGRRG